MMARDQFASHWPTALLSLWSRPNNWNKNCCRVVFALKCQIRYANVQEEVDSVNFASTEIESGCIVQFFKFNIGILQVERIVY